MAKQSFVLSPAICGPASWSSGSSSRGALRLRESRKFYARVCNNEATRAGLAEAVANYTRYQTDNKKWNASVEANKKACQRLLNSPEGVQAALSLGIPPDHDGNRTIDHPLERMAAKLLPIVMLPGGSAQDAEERIPEFARDSCDASFTPRQGNAEHALLIEDYQAVLELMN